ncbi:RNA methyltransferase [Porphyromonas crevioricanis]|uniref:23S rRNA (uracil(1939)-C(5))-methyltransferase RlmD n=1 Tax=Porphyromonas crevioricanis TaxID=393921 RepID=UPI00052D560B|nr:23S rRNA (uracil(1939)-C(5))-methyltransferase RlmD [Porphyromonas crevioricanis]KGN90438.1 RNA methyltransferase [Porphyromonas crevioricanis]
MSRKRKPFPLLENVHIADIAAEGKAIARVDEQVIFVPYAAPGDICDIQIVRKKRSYLEGRIERIITPSPVRVEPRCPHFGICGGCSWQHIPYEVQLKAKQQQVSDALTRIGKIEPQEYLPIVGADETYRYRNKLEFTFSHKRWLSLDEMTSEEEKPRIEPGLGFHIPRLFDKVIDIKQCFLGSDLSDRIRSFVRDYCLERLEDYPFFDLKNQEGMMRSLLIRTASTGEVMVVVMFYHDDPPKRMSLLAAIEKAFPEITSLCYVINPKCNDTLAGLAVEVYSGRNYILEEMEGLRFGVGAKSFYQTNSRQAYKLYSVVREFASLGGQELVYDLYTGTGTIASFVSRFCKKVVGIEYVEDAVADARINCRINGIENATFFAGDMKDILTMDFVSTHGKPDVLITDPPRAGMHDDVIKTILTVEPKRIVYVSCNPATQARDLSILMVDGRYELLKSRAVDMFPQTHHIENVVLLELRKTSLSSASAL